MALRLTSSLWGRPPARFYRLLSRVEHEVLRRPLRVAVLGCADGKFVLPCARRGHWVYGIDKDITAILGGWKIGPTGRIWMSGAVMRAWRERVHDRISLIVGDFVALGALGRAYDLVWTSGAIQYSYNRHHEFRHVLSSIVDHVATGGFLYFDYMLPLTQEDIGRSYYLTRGTISKGLDQEHWEILYERVMPTTPEEGHVDNPLDHLHRWGHLLARRRN